MRLAFGAARQPDKLTAALLSIACYLLQCLQLLVLADVCPSPEKPSTSTAPSSISVPSQQLLDLQHRPVKECPDFKDDAEQSACCPSQINHGNYYCCTREQKEVLESKLAAEARRRFIGSYLLEIVLCSIVSTVFIAVLLSVTCRRMRFCPLYRTKSLGLSPRDHVDQRCQQRISHFPRTVAAASSSSNTGYRPMEHVSSTVASQQHSVGVRTSRKPEELYEAPPPYESIDWGIDNVRGDVRNQPHAPVSYIVQIPSTTNNHQPDHTAMINSSTTRRDSEGMSQTDLNTSLSAN